MKRFFKDLREQATKIINFEKKELLPLAKNKWKNTKKEDFVKYVAN